ncbi:MAG: leucine-rich repeat domain-containing protein [Spirochaetaceae bacterium]|nr:leucine-rich repeat domain-containing protein [Spirochaetaceae bacterium]
MKKAALLFICLIPIIAVAVSCGGGGGGGGGAVSFQDSGAKYHNGGGNSGWGNGGGGFSSSGSDDLLFETIPSFFSPIDHIDITLTVNGSTVELNGLDISAKKDVLGVSNGDKVSGTAVITLADGSTRDATLAQTTIGISNKLSFAVTYKYILQDDAGTAADVEGTYTTAGGIDVSGVTWTRTSGANVDSVECWRSASGTSYAAGGIISGISGDVVLTALYPALYTYTLIDGSGHASNITGTYTFASGIDVSAASSWTSDGTPTGAAISGWKSDTGTVYTPNASGKITGITGDIALTARYPLNVYTINPTTLYRYGSSSLTSSTSYGVSGGTAPYSAVATSGAVDVTVSGTSVDISINPTYGSAIGETVTGTATALGAQITITISDTAGSETDVTVRLVDCIENTSTGIKLNTANTTAAATDSLDIPTSGIVNGASIGDSIPGDAFRNSSGLGNITLPNAITTISNGNFYAATIDDMATNGAFSGSSITGLTAPGLRTIGNGAFANTSISSIDLSSVRIIGKGAFANCSSLAMANLSSVTTLQEYAFANCTGLSNITWYTGTSSVPKYAFYNTGITNLVLPSTITSVGIESFANCTSLSKVTFNGDVTLNTCAFKNCTSLSEIVLPDSSTFIMPVTALEGCSGLQKLTATGATFNGLRLRDSVNTFSDCTALNTLDLLTCSTVSIPTGMLYQATGTVSIKLGSSLSSFRLAFDSSCFLQNLPTMTYEGTSAQFKTALNASNATSIEAGYATYWGGAPTVTCSDGVTVTWNGSSWN